VLDVLGAGSALHGGPAALRRPSSRSERSGDRSRWSISPACRSLPGPSLWNGPQHRHRRASERELGWW